MITLGVLGVLDAILHVLLATLAMIIVYPLWKNKIPQLLLFAIIMEFIIDGAHLVNKSITHNIFFFLETPLFIFLTGYIFKDFKLETFSTLLLANNLSHMLMDLFYEGDSMQIYYPICSTWYSVPHPYLGVFWGTAILLLLLLPMAVFTREFTRKPTQPLTPPPYPI